MFLLLGFSYVPYYCIRTEVLLVGPHNATMGRAHAAEIGDIFKFLEGGAFQIWFHIKNAFKTTAGENLNLVVINRICFDNGVHE